MLTSPVSAFDVCQFDCPANFAFRDSQTEGWEEQPIEIERECCQRQLAGRSKSNRKKSI
jgi:hypothetical protein